MRLEPGEQSRRPRARRAVTILLATAALVGALAGSSHADELTTTDGRVEAGSVAIRAACTASGPTPSETRTQYQSGEYRVVSVNVTNIGTAGQACRSQPYTLGIVDNLGALPLLTEWTGTIPNATSGLLSAASFSNGADVDDLNATNNQVRVFVVTWRSS